MKYTLVVLGAPFTSNAGRSALNFAEALARSEHEIFRVFFYQDGIHQTSAIHSTPQGEDALTQAWQTFCQSNKIDAVTCIAAAARRGIVNDAERARHNLEHSNLAGEYDLSGLGQLVEAMAVSDRTVTFGV